jgi:hypothetical protein
MEHGIVSITLSLYCKKCNKRLRDLGTSRRAGDVGGRWWE